MPQQSPFRPSPRDNGDSAADRRHSPRKPVPEVMVAVELSDTPASPPSAVSDAPGGLAWAGSAIDISREGLALSLPDDIPVGSEVLLTFRLDDETAFARVPSVVVRKQTGFGVGAVQFHGWNRSDQRSLGSFLG